MGNGPHYSTFVGNFINFLPDLSLEVCLNTVWSDDCWKGKAPSRISVEHSAPLLDRAMHVCLLVSNSQCEFSGFLHLCSGQILVLLSLECLHSCFAVVESSLHCSVLAECSSWLFPPICLADPSFELLGLFTLCP